MADRHVALLRGINVGTAKRVAMADLRSLLEGLGYRDVRTLLNSGNIIFTPPKGQRGDRGAGIEKAIAATLGVTTRVIVLTGEEVATAVRDNPLGKVASNPSRLLVMALRDSQAHSRLKPLLKERWAPEALALGQRVAYLWCANGIAESPLSTAVGRLIGDAGTARNMATMMKVLALVDAAGPT
jgi:uncharacterized protein (DUF1697 family)